MSDITMIRTWTGPDERSEGSDWPAPPIYVESAITGELRSRILAKLGRDGTLRLIEAEVEGGYSEFTIETDYPIEVWLDREGAEPERVWSREYDWTKESAMAAFLKWAENDH
jgi:hypothetical protein